MTALVVNYNTPEHLERLLKSFRKYYDMPCIVVDGSSAENYEPIRLFPKRYNIIMYHFDHNIHHGPGMAFGIEQINTDRILLIDSDIIFRGPGIVEIMNKELKDNEYGIGDIQKEKFIDPKNKRIAWLYYLHPAFALINRKVAIRYTLPEKNGAPLISAMREIEQEGSNIIKMSKEVHTDFWDHTEKYIQHNHNHIGMGTVTKTGSYNY